MLVCESRVRGSAEVKNDLTLVPALHIRGGK